jgi:hypothetical protein
LVLVVDADLRVAKKAAWLVTMGGAVFLGDACFRGFGLGVVGWIAWCWWLVRI